MRVGAAASGGVQRNAAAFLVLSALLTACSDSPVRDAAPRSGAIRNAPVSRARPGEHATVARGETLYAIATRKGVSVTDLAAWNRLSPPYTVYPGQRLRLYPGGRRNDNASRADVSGARTSAMSHVQPVPAPAAASAPASSGFSWRWPAAGAVLERFEAGEPTRHGIDIAGEAGDVVRAAADGRVVYSGAGLVGYGELVIIKHNDAWLSAYGHNRKRLVGEGQQVKSGDAIAEMGHSGAPRDMLHFEIRYNGKPVDPQAYLPTR